MNQPEYRKQGRSKAQQAGTVWLSSCLLLLSLVGCGGGEGSSMTTGSANSSNQSGPQPPPPVSAQTSSVLFRFTLAPRAIPPSISHLRFTGFSANGEVLWGPRTLPKQTEITLTEVPTSVTRFQVEYLSNGAVRGLANLPCTLVAGGTWLISDPNFQDVAAVLQSLVVESSPASIAAGLKAQLSALGRFNDGSQQDLTGSVTWESSKPGVASVSPDGQVLGVSAGRSQITARLGGVEGVFQFEVTAAVLTGIECTPANLTLARGSSGQVITRGLLSDGSRVQQQVDWTSDNPAIATVDPSGLVQSVAQGTTSIRASLGNFRAQVGVEVTPAALASLEIQPPNPTLAQGTTLDLKLRGRFTDQSEQDLSQVTWTSGDDRIASILNNGRVTAKAQGATLLTATDLVSGRQAATNVTVAEAALQSLELTPLKPWVIGRQTRRLTVFGHFSNGTRQDVSNSVSYSSSNSTLISVTNSPPIRGVIEGLSHGQSDIVVSYPGSSVTNTTRARCLNYQNVGTLATTGQAARLLSNLDGSRLFVLEGNQLLVVNPVSRSIEARVPGGGRGMALSPDGHTLLISSSQSWLQAVDTRSLAHFTIPLSRASVDVAIDGRGRAYALAEGLLMTIDLATSQQIGTISSNEFFYVGFLQIDRASQALYVAQRGLSPSSILRWDVSGAQPQLRESIRSGSNGQSLKVNPGKGLIFACGGGNSQPSQLGYILTSYGLSNFLNPLGFFRIGTYPRDAAFSADGEVIFGINGDSYDPKISVARWDEAASNPYPFTTLTTPLNGGYSRNYLVTGSTDDRFLFLHTFDDYLKTNHNIVFYQGL